MTTPGEATSRAELTVAAASDAVRPVTAACPTPRRLRVPFVLLLLAGLTTAALGHVWVRLEQLQAGYALSQEVRQAHRLAETQKRLRLEAEVLKQPERIERLARARLGMAVPPAQNIHVIRVKGGQ